MIPLLVSIQFALAFSAAMLAFHFRLDWGEKRPLLGKTSHRDCPREEEEEEEEEEDYR